jgi:hypothetical protein
LASDDADHHIRLTAGPRGTHDTTTFENIETKKRCADFPHFNALLTFAEGDPKTAHVYHTPGFSALNGITVVLATRRWVGMPQILTQWRMRLCTPPDGKPCFQCSMTVCSYSLLCPARRNSHPSPPARQFDTVKTSWHYRHKPLSHLNPILSNPPADFSRHERELCFTKQREVARRYSVYAWRRALRDIDVLFCFVLF